VRSKYGFWYVGNVFDAQDIAYGVASNGTIESFDTELVLSILKELPPDFVFYDVGANTGWYTMLASSISNSSLVHSFEPVNEHIQCLKESVFLNKKDTQVSVHEVALSDKKGETTILLAGTGSSLEQDFLTSNNGTRKINTDTLDTLAINIPSPDFIKIDVEGHEYKVLQGAKNTLEKHAPILYVEIADTLKNIKRDFVHPDFDKIFKLLESYNYVAFISKNNELKRFNRSDKNNESYMFLFLNKDKHSNLIAEFSR
jgi:FkbM family methyltransferase